MKTLPLIVVTLLTTEIVGAAAKTALCATAPGVVQTAYCASQTGAITKTFESVKALLLVWDGHPERLPRGVRGGDAPHELPRHNRPIP